MRVLVTGGSGFVGNHVVQALLDAGNEVIALSRKAPLGDRFKSNASYYEGVDVSVAATLKPEYFERVEAVIHLVGIIAEKPPVQTFERVHVLGTRNVVEQTTQFAPEARFIYLSAIGSAPDAPAVYSRTKYAAEVAVGTSGLPFVILRPSLILGADGEFAAQMKSLILHGGLPLPLPFPFVPIPGSGENKFQPLSVTDLVRCLVDCLDSTDALNQTVEVGGATQVTFNQIIDSFSRELRVRKPRLHVPIPLLRVAASVMGLMPNPPATRDQLKNLSRDNTCDLERMRAVFGFKSDGFEEVMKGIFHGDEPGQGRPLDMAA